MSKIYNEASAAVTLLSTIGTLKSHNFSIIYVTRIPYVIQINFIHILSEYFLFK